MTDPVKEQLSACLDGELPEGELDLLLKQVGRDPQLRASLGRYSLIGETLRAQRPAVAPADFSLRVAAAIAAEPAADISSVQLRSKISPATSRWLRPVAGLAVAAGVAAVAILALQPTQEDPTATFAAQTAAPVAITDAADDAASYIVPANTAASGFVPAARLTNYVVAHSEYSSPLGRRSVLSGVLSEEDSGDAADGDAMTDASTDSENVTQP